MKDAKLITPEKEDVSAFKASYLDALGDGITMAIPGSMFSQAEIAEIEENFDAHLQEYYTTFREGFITLDDGEQVERVPQTDYWLADGGRVVGLFRLRHRLNAHLLLSGGHIGYIVRESCRRQGYATAGLKLTLEKAAEIGLDRVLVTCDDDNAASAQVIEKNGGVMENKVTDPKNGILRRRYWISF